jgi:hypothetical protein
MYDRLLEAVASVAIPGAPPRMSSQGARIGLSFLETVLRQNHTRRFSEDLSLGKRGVVSRTIRQEISLASLTGLQRTAGREYVSYRAASDSVMRSTKELSPIWIPLAHVNRRSSPPIIVRDNMGRAIPTMTRGESSELFAPAICRLFRRILETNASPERPGDLDRLLTRENEARWLLQQAVISLTTERAPARSPHVHHRTSGTALATGGKQRELLKDSLEQLRSRGELDDFLALMTVAIDEQVLVACLNERMTDHELTYSVPVNGSVVRTALFRTAWKALRQLVPGRPDYLIAYHTAIPSGVESYHITAATDATSDVADALLIVDSSSAQMRRLIKDFQYLSDARAQYGEGQLRPSQIKLLEYELQDGLKSLSELVRRRQWEAEWQDLTIRDSVVTASSALAQVAQSGEGYVDRSQENPMVHASLLTHPSVTRDRLLEVSAELSRVSLGKEICVNPQPLTEGNLSWRRSESRESKHDVNARCLIRVVDAVGTRGRNVVLFGLALFAISYGVLVGSYQSFDPVSWLSPSSPLTDVEAKVLVLLLVPGFLYTRLDTGDRGSISSALRRGPRLLALGMIAAVLGVAISLAAPVTDALARKLSITMLGLLLLLLVIALVSTLNVDSRWWVSRHVKHGWKLPLWLNNSRRLSHFSRPPDAIFEAAGLSDGQT